MAVIGSGRSSVEEQFLTKKLADALKNFNAAIELQADFMPALLQRGEVHSAVDRDKADTVLSVEPDCIQHFVRGHLFPAALPARGVHDCLVYGH